VPSQRPAPAKAQQDPRQALRGTSIARTIFAFAVLAVGACDPTPSYPPPEQPLVGTVSFEQEITMGAGPTEISTVQATVDIDPGTIPVGDHLLVRLLRGVTKATPSGSGNVWMIGAEPAAVQLLPATATFAKPVHLRLPFFPTQTGAVDVLHADEAATSWSWVAQATLPSPGSGSFTAELTEPHLWTLVGSNGNAPPPDGIYALDQFICGNDLVSPPPASTLELAGGTYVWTWARSPGDAGCGPVTERGTVAISQLQATFTPDVGFPRRYDLKVLGGGFALEGGPSAGGECPGQSVFEQFTPIFAPKGVPNPMPPGATDAGCGDAGSDAASD
jgi:hypothetical protein